MKLSNEIIKKCFNKITKIIKVSAWRNKVYYTNNNLWFYDSKHKKFDTDLFCYWSRKIIFVDLILLKDEQKMITKYDMMSAI